MKISLLLHLYQPSYQEKATFKNVADECYIPLLKFIKSKKDFSVTINTPLSLLEQMDSLGYTEWLKDLKGLVGQGRVELTGCGAYHPILTKIPQNYVESQVVLNEYALGYYFGRRQGFEGEKEIMVKDLDGFFPPEMAINNDLVGILDGLGYRWVVADETALVGIGDAVLSESVFKLKDHSIKIVIRSRDLSNAIAFKRDSSVDDIVDLVRDNTLVALDGETFGHHNSYGVHFLENFYSHLKKNNCSVLTVSDLIRGGNTREIEGLRESSWGASDEQINNDNVYPMWDIEDNEAHKLLWALLNYTIENVKYDLSDINADNKPLWKYKSGKKQLEEDNVDLNIVKYILTHQIMNSDQFWWSSNVTLGNRVHLYHKALLELNIALYSELLTNIDDEGVKGEINKKISAIKDAIIS